MMVKYKHSTNNPAKKISPIKLPTDENQLVTPPEEISSAMKNAMQAAKSPVRTLTSGEIFRLISIRYDAYMNCVASLRPIRFWFVISTVFLCWWRVEDVSLTRPNLTQGGASGVGVPDADQLAHR